MKRLAHALLLAAALLAAACTQPGASGAPIPRTRNLITRDEVLAAREMNAFQLIERLHPQWLQKRGARDLDDQTEIIVYFDRARMGGPTSLRNISLQDVDRIEFLPAPEAETRFGIGHRHGAIVIHSR